MHPLVPGFVGECETPKPPTAVSVTDGHYGASVSPRVTVMTWDFVKVRLYANDTCEGEPVWEWDPRDSGSGIEVKVRRGVRTIFRATAVNPRHGQESSCSESFATYRQIDPVLTRPVLRMPRSIRAGTKRVLKITVRNLSLVAAENVMVKIRSTNRKVRLTRQVQINRIEPGSKVTVKVALKAGQGASGRVRVKATVAGKEGSRVVRISR